MESARYPAGPTRSDISPRVAATRKARRHLAAGARDLLVLVAGEDRVCVEGLAAMLSRFQGFVIVESCIGADSVPERPDPLPVDMVVLHGAAGDEMDVTIRSFKESQPQAKIFVVLSSFEMGRLPRLLATGICGCALASTITAEGLAAGLWAAAWADAVVLNNGVWSHLCQLLTGSIGAAACPASIRLSQRQEEVLTSLARGLTERQIASVLGVSEKTVQSHVARMRERLGAVSMFQLGMLLGRNALV